MNPFAILFSIISLPEPAIADDDTALFVPVQDEPLTLLVTSFADVPVMFPERLLNQRVQYVHFEGSDELYTGMVTEIRLGKFGMEFHIEPDRVEGLSLLAKWKYQRDLTGRAQWVEG